MGDIVAPMKSLIILGGMAAALAGCIPPNDSLRAKLEPRAQFDLNCPNLQIVPLEKTNGWVTSYGVTGCGRRATYILNASTNSWVMNVADGQSMGAGPEDPPPPPRHTGK